MASLRSVTKRSGRQLKLFVWQISSSRRLLVIPYRIPSATSSKPPCDSNNNNRTYRRKSTRIYYANTETLNNEFKYNKRGLNLNKEKHYYCCTRKEEKRKYGERSLVYTLLCYCFRMVRKIADEFLTDERDRKYYADQYTCCPPPLFIIIITLVEVSTNYFFC